MISLKSLSTQEMLRTLNENIRNALDLMESRLVISKWREFMVMEFKLFGELISSTLVLWHCDTIWKWGARGECRLKLCFKSKIVWNWLCINSDTESQRPATGLWDCDSCQSRVLVRECLCQEITVRRAWRASPGRGASWAKVSGGSRPARICSLRSTRDWGSTTWGRWGRSRTATCSTASTAPRWRMQSSPVAPPSCWWANTPPARRHS